MLPFVVHKLGISPLKFVLLISKGFYRNKSRKSGRAISYARFTWKMAVETEVMVVCILLCNSAAFATHQSLSLMNLHCRFCCRLKIYVLKSDMFIPVKLLCTEPACCSRVVPAYLGHYMSTVCLRIVWVRNVPCDIQQHLYCFYFCECRYILFCIIMFFFGLT